MEAPLTCPKCHKSLDDAPNYCPACGEDLRGLGPLSDTLSGSWHGRIIDGRYRLREKLGEGGMGAVYKVEHVRMEKVLALKLLRPDLAIDKKVKARFRQEARVVSKLSHPNTIQVFDFGELDDGELYIAMEYLPGRDLAWTLRAHGPFSEERAIVIGVQVLSSLAEAHEQDIVHRDVKPANVMLVKRRDREDLVKVLDFGIAKLSGGGEGRKHITGVADFIGTPAYMSPEQAKGEEQDERSDLYSVAAMLFELVTGRGVFDGPTPLSVVSKHMTEAPPRLSEVAPDKVFSPAFEQVLRRALAKDRADRFASADEMREALEQVRRELGQPGTEITPLLVDTSEMARREDFDRLERSLRLRRLVAPAVTLALLAAAGLGGYRWLLRPDEAAPRTEEREPNDDYDHANLIALGQPVTGKVGTPLSDQGSDRDIYVVDVPGPEVLAVELGGLADLNLVMQLTQVEPDKRQLFVDDAPPGEGERVDAVAAFKGKLYIRVEERHHFTEAPRPPRENSRAAYTLTVRRAGAAGQLEVEPNDTLETATRLGTGKSVLGFTGAPLPYEARTCEQLLSTADFLAAWAEEAGPPTSALVVPPPGGKLAVVDGGEFEEWRQKLGDRAARAVLPRPLYVSGKPEVLALSSSSRGRVVRIQAVDTGTPAGSPYHVAFFTGQPEGMAAVLELARSLDEAGRGEDAEAVLRLAERTYPRSPQIEELRALLAGL